MTATRRDGEDPNNQDWMAFHEKARKEIRRRIVRAAVQFFIAACFIAWSSMDANTGVKAEISRGWSAMGVEWLAMAIELGIVVLASVNGMLSLMIARNLWLMTQNAPHLKA